MVARRVGRWLSTVVLVLSTSLGLVVSTSGTAAAAEWGPGQRLILEPIAEGLQKGVMAGGVRSAGPGTVGRANARCLASGPGAVGCMALTTAGAALIIGGYQTQDLWWPWLKDQLQDLHGGDPGMAQNPCARMEWTVTPASPMTVGRFTAGGDVKVKGIFLNQGTGGSTCYAGFTTQTKCVAGDGSVKTLANGNNYTFPLGSGSPTQTRDFAGRFDSACSSASRVLEVIVTPTVWTAGTDISEGFGAGMKWQAGDDPAGQTTSRISCKRPDGSSYEVNRSSIPIDGHVQVAACDPGDVPTSLFLSNASGSNTTDLTSDPADAATYPLCASAACFYRVLVDGQPCTVGSYACTHWSHLSRQPSTASRVECHYGPYRVAIDLCYWLERAYSLEAPARTVTKKNTDGDPLTWDEPASSPAWDPATVPTPTPTPTFEYTPRPTVTASPEPTVTVSPQPSPDACRSSYALGRVQPQTVYGVNVLGPMFDIGTVGGYREDPIPDHPSGLAADFMVGTDAAKGGFLSEYAKTNAGALNIEYIIWDQRIWSQARASEGWRPMADRGSPTANHKDHVHVTFLGDAAGVPCAFDPGAPVPEGNPCFASGWSGLLNPVEFVVNPLRCLFVPRKTLDSRVAVVRAEFDEKGPAKFFTAAGQLISGIDDGAGGCRGPSMQFEVEGVSQVMYPFDACAEPMKTVASYTHALSWVVIVVGGILAITRAVAMGFGFQFSMGKGGKDE